MVLQVMWKNGSPAQFLSIGTRMEKKLQEAMAAAMMIVIDNAVAAAKQGTADRVDSGRMIEAISGKILAEGKSIIGQFGFTTEQEEYFLYQTVTGFTHWLSGEYIEPTFALLHAYEGARNELKKVVEAAARSI